jgi:hypothetical protein
MTFPEVHAGVGLEIPRQYIAESVLRTAPCLPGLFSVICLIYVERVRSHLLGIR